MRTNAQARWVQAKPGGMQGAKGIAQGEGIHMHTKARNSGPSPTDPRSHLSRTPEKPGFPASDQRVSKAAVRVVLAWKVDCAVCLFTTL